MKLEKESFDFKYVSDEIMSNLSLAQDHSTVFTIQGTFSYLLYSFAKLLSYKIIIPPANFVCRGYTVFTLSVRPCVSPSVRPCVSPSVRPSIRNTLFP